MTRGYAARSGKPEAEIAALMASETWFDAQEALEAGLATRLAEPVRIAASFDIARFRNAPLALVEAVPETVAASNGFDAQDTAPDAEGTGPDQDSAEPDPESLAEEKTFDAAQTDSPGCKGADGAIEEGMESAPQSPGDEGDVDDPNIPSLGPALAAGSASVPAALATSDASAIRAEAIAHARAVIDLCRLAGQPQMAGRFLEEEASLEVVRARLIEARAEATAEITPHHPQPGRSTTARPWGDVIARTFKLKG